MADNKFDGKTRAEWLALRGKSGLGCPEPAKIEQALLSFEQADRQAQIEREENRFQIQLDETRRQGSLTRLIAWLALVVSAGSVVVAICALSSRSASSPQQTAPLSQPVALSVSQTTIAAPATVPKP